jgi:hypothetical protein
MLPTGTVLNTKGNPDQIGLVSTGPMALSRPEGILMQGAVIEGSHTGGVLYVR